MNWLGQSFSKAEPNLFKEVSRMRRLLPIWFLLLFMTGCVGFLAKISSPTIETKEVFIGEIKTYKDPEFTAGGRIKNIGLPTNDKKIAKVFEAALAAELEKAGFILTKQPGIESLVVKTRIGDHPAPLGGWLGIFAMGIVVVEVEVYQNDNLLLRLEDGMNTTLGYSSKKQAGRLTPRVVEKIKENLY